MSKFREIGKQQQVNMLIVAAIIAVIVGGMLVVWFTISYSQYKEKDASLFSRLSGQKYEFDGDIKIINERDQCKLTIKNSKVEYFLDRVPVYSKDKSRTLFIEPMGVVFVDSYVELKKIAAFSTVIETIDGQQIVTPSGKKYDTKNKFLYNGKDTYYFPNGATIYQGSREIKISPMSYVLAMTNYQLEIFNYGTGGYTIERTLPEKSIAKIGNIQIDLEYDRVIDKEGIEVVLMPQIEKLLDLEN